MTPGRALALALVVTCGLASCSKSPPDPAASAGPPLAIDATGCAAVLVGGICELPADRTLRLVVDAETPADTRLVGAAGSLTPGETTTVTVATEATEVRATAGDRMWRLVVRAPEPVPVLEDVAALRKDRKADEALARIALALPGAPPEIAGRLLGQRARIALARGDTATAVASFRDALPLHRAAGRATDEVNDALALAFVQIHQTRDFAGARATLEATEAPAAWDAESRAGLHVHRARLALETGDLRSALREVDFAMPELTRLGAALRLSFARQARAEALQALGRHAEAVALFRTMLGEAPPNPCARTSLENGLAWALLQQFGDTPAPAEVGALLEKAAASFHTDCPRPADEAAVQINRALFALHSGDLAGARRALDTARTAQPKPDARLTLWSTDIEGQVALRSGDFALAIERFGRLRALGASTVSADAEWRGTLGQARALRAAKREHEAGQAFARAEALLSDQALQIPLAEGRETFFAEREAGTTDFVEFLVAAGQPAKAMQVARRARARFLAAIRRADRLPGLQADERARWDTAIADYQRARAALDEEATGDWTLPIDQLERARAGRGERERALRSALDTAFAVLSGPDGGAGPELAPPPDDEVVLTWFPGHTGLLAFVADARATQVVRLANAAPEHLLDAFDAAQPPAGAAVSKGPSGPNGPTGPEIRRIRVLPYGPVRGMDVHALPWRGRPLLAHAAVVYGLDLPVAPGSIRPPEPAAPRRALVVSDPRGDLPGARAEADAVSAALPEWQVTRLDGEAASGLSVREGLAAARLFHFAGHGRFGGAHGWESALPLAGAGLLSVHDILALPAVPADVVLSGCETARQADTAPLEEVGLAQAFLAAGARTAIAATRPVDDTLARDLSAALYTHLRTGSAADPAADAPDGLAQALRQAQLDLAQAFPTRDWAAFRILVR